MLGTRHHQAPLLAAAHLGQAAILLQDPSATLRRISGDDVPPSFVVHLLGVRTLLQGVAEACFPDRRTLRISAAIDAAHAVSMLGAALAWPRYRRAALVSAVTAAGCALTGATLAGNQS
jgi:hypothetical protein